MYTLGFIGCGNMGGALARAAAKSIPAGEIAASSGDGRRARRLAEELGCTAADNAAIAAQSRFVVLGVKPQGMAALLQEIAPVLAARRDEFVLVSMAAGLTIRAQLDMLGAEYPFLRIMPNTPVSVGRGTILYASSALVTARQKEEFLAAFAAAGSLEEIPEQQSDAGSVLCGCGPAFTYLFIEALSDGAVQCGLPREKALRYAAQMVEGSARMVLESGKHPGQLKDAVCSPGGTTIVGVHALERDGLRNAAMDAVTEAYRRTLELSKK